MCSAYFRRIATVRGQEELAPASTPSELHPEHRLAAGLDLRRALLAVGPDCRRRLIDKYLVGLTLEEMASQESVSAQTLRSRLHACRERLRASWHRHVEGRKK